MSLVLPRAEWPETDRILWEALWRSEGPLDDPGGLAHLRQTTAKTLEARYARWLRWLSLHDADALLMPPEERATILRLQSWLIALAHTKPMSQLAFVEAVLRVLRAAGPDLDWAPQRRLLAHLKRAAGRGDPDRKTGRILSSEVLLCAGLTYDATVVCASRASVQQLVRHRDAAMIALLAVLPMRRRSFCELTLGRSIQLAPDGILIALSEEMTKTGLPWEAKVPPQVDPLLRRYIFQTRQTLLARGDQQHDRLWVGKKGEIMGEDYTGARIGTLTLKLTGARVSPHLFRDAAATTLARLSPDSAGLIRPVLAHSGFRTAERHYIHAHTIDAGRDYAALIKQIKRGQ